MMQKHDYPRTGSATLHLALLAMQSIHPGTQAHNGKAARSFPMLKHSLLKSRACEAGTNRQQPVMWGSKTLLEALQFLAATCGACFNTSCGREMSHA